MNKYRSIKRGRRGSHRNSYKNKFIVPHLFIRNLENEFISSYNVNRIKSSVFSIRVRVLKKIFAACSNFKFQNAFFKDLILDLLHFKLKHLTNTHIDNVYFVLTFQQKSFGHLQFAKVFNKFSNIFPVNNIHISISFKYNKPFSSVVYNYRQIVDSANDNFECACNNSLYSRFIDLNHGHVITGDLSIIGNINIRTVLGFGTKFRINKKLSKKYVRLKFIEELDCFVLNFSYNYNTPPQAFAEWRSCILNYFDSFCSVYLNSNDFEYNVIDKKDFEFLDEFKKYFVISSVDKASTNYAII